MTPRQTNPDFFPVLTVAGSDNSAGAGIQADIKTFMALGCYGFSAVSAITAQNMETFASFEPVAPQLLYEQIQYAVQCALPLTMKTGMLATVENIRITARAIQEFHLANLVIDPVLKSSTGEILTSKEVAGKTYVDTLKSDLIQTAFAVTPNRMEAEILAGIAINNYDDVHRAAQIIYNLGVKNVIIKGGHLDFDPDYSVDTLFTGLSWHTFSQKRTKTLKAFHGTGCTFSAALCAFLARGLDIEKSVESAKKYVVDAMENFVFPGILNHLPESRP